MSLGDGLIETDAGQEAVQINVSHPSYDEEETETDGFGGGGGGTQDSPIKSPVEEECTGVDDHCVLWVVREVDNVAIKLGCLTGLLQDIKLHPEFAGRLLESRLQLQSLVSAIDEVLLQVGDGVVDTSTTNNQCGSNLNVSPMATTNPSTQARAPTPPNFGSMPRPSQKRTIVHILPPSPEKRSSKRHNSYSVH